MALECPVRIVLVDPPAGVDFGVQRGRGAEYETIGVRRSTRGDLSFDFSLTIANTRRDGPPNFVGPFAPLLRRWQVVSAGRTRST
jgi:hypothetical protein